MNFSKHRKLIKVLSLIFVLILMTTLFAGCKKDDSTPGETGDSGPNLNLKDDTDPSESQTEPTQTEPAVVNENMGTVTAQLTVRATPSTDAAVLGTLYAGDRVEVTRQHTIIGVNWGYISDPEGWVVMDYVAMDTAGSTGGGQVDDPDTSTPAATTPSDESATTNIKGVITGSGVNIRSEASTNGKIVGSYSKGDVVTILETQNGWGRTSQGWVKMDYVSTTGTTTNNNTNNTTNTTTNNNTTNNTTTTTTGNGSTTVIAKGIVTATQLNIRSSASTDGDKVGSLSYGDRVEILEKSGSWGRTSKGWIHMDYVYEDGTTGSKTAGGIVTGSNLNIRSGPGTGYDSVGSLNAGDRVNILEQFTYSGTTWGCTSKGWICLDYVYIDGTGTGNDKTGTVTADNLNIRSGPGTGYNSVGTLNSGDDVTILYEVTVGDTTWGNISKGWISMDYVELDEY